MMESCKSIARFVRDTGSWRPSRAALVWQQVIGRSRNEQQGWRDEHHLLAALRWLERAQDATGDGGVAGRFRLDGGWSSSYPETTGYIVPTWLRAARELEEPRYRERAGKCIDFLLGVQLESGAFPGLEIAENRDDPSPFNTGQIVNGLTEWYRETGDERALRAALRAGNWLVSIQDDDGAFRRHYHANETPTYSAHLTCWLAVLGAALGEQRFLESAGRHLDWVLALQNPATGWFRYAANSDQDFALTHTIAYTIWGVLLLSEVLRREDGLTAARSAADAVLRRLEISGALPGLLDSRWRSASNYACLTGNAQMALIWFKLFDRHGDARYLNAGFKSIDLIKRAQPMRSRDAGVRGGIPGSDPIWGAYIRNAVPNWAAKFFVDALLEKRRMTAVMAQRPRGRWRPPRDLPRQADDATSVSEVGRQLSVLMLAHAGGVKLEQMLMCWHSFGFKPGLVLIESPAEPGVAARLLAKLRADGVRAVIRRLFVASRANTGASIAGTPRYVGALEYCKRHGLNLLVVPDINGPAAVDAARRFAPDLAIHAGAGLLRRSILSVPRLGTLNAHMGLLPRYRGLNVAEWAAFNGDPVGCTVHLIDEGIDTGGILCTREVEIRGASSIAELRERVDNEQLKLLGHVLRRILRTGMLPEIRSQAREEGVQHHRMHRELATRLEAELGERGRGDTEAAILAAARASTVCRDDRD